jgi:hypothetical protein
MERKLSDDRLKAIVSRQQDKAKAAVGPLENKWIATSRLDVFQSHNVDLAMLLLVTLAGAVVAVAVVLKFESFSSATSSAVALQIIFGATIFGTTLELLRRTYETAVKRLATIDLFSIEILSIMRVFAAANIIGDFVYLYDKVVQRKPSRPLDATDPRSNPAPVGWADSGTLDPSVINDVTAFYTFLRASRDATGALKLWKDPSYEVESMKADVIAIIYLCFLMAVHGSRALDELITSKHNVRIASDIVAGVQLQCFAFLDHVLLQDDFRRGRLEQRREECRKLRKDNGYLFGPE